MLYLLVFLFSLFLGWKFHAAYVLLRQTRDVKFIEKTIEMILSKERIKLVEINKKEDTKVEDPLSEYEEFLMFKKSKEVEA